MNLRAIATILIVFALMTALANMLVLRWIARHPPPAPRGRKKKPVATVPAVGGLSVVPMMALGWLAAAALGIAPNGTVVVTLAMIGLAAISFQDMRRPIPFLYRFTAQAIAVVLGLIFLPGAGHVFFGLLPVTLDLIVTAMLWIGLINFIPRLDRQEGLATILCLMTGLGVALVGILAADPTSGLVAPGLATAAVALGYIGWAWPPARLHLGGVGTVPLGFVIAWLVLGLTGSGHRASALILVGYYVIELAKLVHDRVSPAAPLSGRWANMIKKYGPGWSLRRIIAGHSALLALAALAVWWPKTALLLAILILTFLARILAGLPGVPFTKF